LNLELTGWDTHEASFLRILPFFGETAVQHQRYREHRAQARERDDREHLSLGCSKGANKRIIKPQSPIRRIAGEDEAGWRMEN
jgi:hypothetical protein